ncbi:MAG: hypothetical protein J6Z25_02755 [Opitutales bacterium]|nr:hypothetical protein [Opitutales bacterium]
MKNDDHTLSFLPIYVERAGLASHSIKHLRHSDALPLSVPRQGMVYFDAKRV